MSRERVYPRRSNPLELSRKARRRLSPPVSPNSKRPLSRSTASRPLPPDSFSLSEISVKDTIGDIPGLWVHDFKVRPGILDVLGLSRLPDIDDVKKDVDGILKEIRQREKERNLDLDMDDLKKDVASIVKIMEKADIKSKKGDVNYSSRELRNVSLDVRRMIRRIDAIGSRTAGMKTARELPDIDDVSRDVRAISDLSDIDLAPIHFRTNSIPGGSIKGHRSIDRDKEGMGKKQIGSINWKRLIPFIFLAGAAIAYSMVFMRQMFEVPISRILPLSVKPNTIYLTLLFILFSTSIVNVYRRIMITRARRSNVPMWGQDGGMI
ncbi:MAG: hypothetical protein U9R75_06215 [Candidatus Thermoplasmatota archaeon]|nr:hypothetical protein [Candidatus Thermoplasmatota archaeon]